jgi:hypothetical protein
MPMMPLVLPLRMVVFQTLFLLMAIALEAIVLFQGLQVTPRKGVEYATAINFLAMVIGWVLFLNLQVILPESVRFPMMSFILFDYWSNDLLTLGIVTAIATFFLSFVIKALGLNFLQQFLGDRQPEIDPSDPKSIEINPEKTQITLAQERRLKQEQQWLGPTMKTVLAANALSYSTIALVLSLRFWWPLN